MSLYKAIDIWERKDSRTAVRYRCFESLDTGKFSVQIADVYHVGKSPAKSDVQCLELFTEQDPLNAQGNTGLSKPQSLPTTETFAEDGSQFT
jgi:hypothetical protein